MLSSYLVNSFESSGVSKKNTADTHDYSQQNRRIKRQDGGSEPIRADSTLQRSYPAWALRRHELSVYFY